MHQRKQAWVVNSVLTLNLVRYLRPSVVARDIQRRIELRKRDVHPLVNVFTIAIEITFRRTRAEE